jgi:hypothetical protein
MFGAEGGADEAKILDAIGTSWEDKWQLNVDVMVETGVISAPIELDRIFTNEFITEWDKAQVEADAAAYDWQSVAANYEAG